MTATGEPPTRIDALLIAQNRHQIAITAPDVEHPRTGRHMVSDQGQIGPQCVHR